jgi:dihydrolipoamide dehydrogenase
MEVDVAVLGGAPGGYTAAIRAAQCGARVACIERAPELGGTCLRIGCIPTKAWVQTAFALKQAEEKFEKLGVSLDGSYLEFTKANAWEAAVVKQRTQGEESLPTSIGARPSRIEAHGGRIWTSHNVGPGATFPLPLPLPSAQQA